MQVSIESGEGLERRMTVELSAEVVQEKVEERLKDMARTIRMDGFRPGKVPVRMVRQRFGAAVRQEIIGDMIESTYFEAVSQEGVKPAGMPRIDDLDVEKASYVAVFEVMPEIEPADMSGVNISRPQVEVTDADVEEMIEKLRQQRSTFEIVEREAAMDDQVVINFSGSVEGEAFEGGSGENTPIVLGSKSLIDGFEEGLVGASAGDKRTLELKFPDDYRVDNLAGKDTVFEVEVTEVREKKLPEIDAEYIKTFGVESGELDDFKADVRNNMDNELKQKIKTTVKDRVMDALLEKNQLSVPQAMIDQEAEELKKQAKQNMAQRGQATDFDLPVELFKEQAQRRVALGLILHELMQKHEIQADDERINASIEEMAQSFEKPEEVIDYYNNDKNARASVENLVLEEQVVELIMSQVNVEEEVMDFNSFMNPEETAVA